MDEQYRSGSAESRDNTTTTSSQPNGAVETCLQGLHRSVHLPRELTDYEKILWERHGADTDSYGPSLNLFADWIMRVRSSLDVLEDSAGLANREAEGRLLSTIHMMRRAFDDFDILLKLAYDMLPGDPTVLRRIEKAHGPLLSSSLTAKGDVDSADLETLQ